MTRFHSGHYVALGVLLLVAVMAAAVPLAAEAVSDQPAHLQDDVIYVVKPGDRLVDIAARYGVSASAIVRANRLVNSDVIYPGQKLIIPVAGPATATKAPTRIVPTAPLPANTPTPVVSVPTAAPTAAQPTRVSAPPTPSGPKYYTVQLGDTLDKIARAHGVTSAALRAANNISNPDLIYVGQRLLIPGTGTGNQPAPTAKPATPKTTIYTVQAGDTLSAIAQRHGTTVAALVAANGLGSADKIRVGMRLVIPKAGSSPTYPGRATSFVASISQQRCYLYRGDTLISKWVCSTGRSGSATRPGTYRIQSKLPKAYGSTWNIWMPYWLGIYWAGASENGIHGLPWNATSGVQIWSGNVGTPITYGCVMLDNVNAKMLYDMAYIGMPVIIKP